MTNIDPAIVEACALPAGSKPTLAEAVARLIDAARAEALREAADAWQEGQWADSPRHADRIQERVATAQYVTDWLRARAEAITRNPVAIPPPEATP